jgi:phenylacetic acid degradation operon negative regulatory protein
VNARAALFDLYGDHLRSRGGAAPVGGLIRALGTLDIAAPAVRTAVSRMVQQGWLTPARQRGVAVYRLTDRAVHRLDEAAERIYRTREVEWDGRWHLVVLSRIRERSRRDRVRAGLRYLGYGPIDDVAWIAPRPSSELTPLLEAEAVGAETFTADHDADTRALVERVWDLPALATSYLDWLRQADDILAGIGPSTSDDRAFAARSRLLHVWRKFLFSDPQLPAELLPRDWPGRRAARHFDAHAQRLLPAAARFVDDVLHPATNGVSSD